MNDDQKANLIVESRIRDTVKGMELRCSAELVGALNDLVYDVIEKAAERCRENNRSTLKEHDL